MASPVAGERRVRGRRSTRTRRERRASRQGGAIALITAPRCQTVAARLRMRLGVPVELELTDNTYTMISFTRRDGSYQLRLHHMFLQAADPILEALASYVRGDDRRASGLLDRFIEANRHLIRRLPVAERQRRLALRTRGRTHDLQRLLNEVRARFFGRDARTVAIAWAPAPRVQVPRRSIKLGSYSADAQLIRIHPALDQPFVPAFFVRWIIYHELLHHLFRRELQAHNGCVHPPAFRALELLFPEVQAAMAWERRYLELLLRWQPDDGPTAAVG